MALPVIDVSNPSAAGEAMGAACSEVGFFYAIGHGVAAATLERVEAAARAFFALPEDEKMAIAMARGGRAWRGYFPLGGELTSGVRDRKQGLYFGEELSGDDPRVAAGLPLHGANLFPRAPSDLKPAVLQLMSEYRAAARTIMEGLALSLGLDGQYFERTYTAQPTLLFRIFEYPPALAGEGGWGVGEHTDYGLLTLLAQDANGGLQVKTRSGWTDAAPIPGALVCNIGDMLDRLTGGFYRSTPHRVCNVSGKSRLSFPFFFDPGFEAEIVPLPARAKLSSDDSAERWDGANLHAMRGPYGDYLLSKVGKVFPELAREVSGGGHHLHERAPD